MKTKVKIFITENRGNVFKKYIAYIASNVIMEFKFSSQQFICIYVYDTEPRI